MTKRTKKKKKANKINFCSEYKQYINCSTSANIALHLNRFFFSSFPFCRIIRELQREFYFFRCERKKKKEKEKIDGLSTLHLHFSSILLETIYFLWPKRLRNVNSLLLLFSAFTSISHFRAQRIAININKNHLYN